MLINYGLGFIPGYNAAKLMMKMMKMMKEIYPPRFIRQTGLGLLTIKA